MTGFFALLCENIDKPAHVENMDLVYEFVGIILYELLSQSKTILMNGEGKPRELVKRNLLKLNCFDVGDVLNEFKK